ILRIHVQKGFFTSTIGLTILGIVFAIFLVSVGIFTYYYVKYSRMIDARLSGNILQNTTQIFSAPEHLSVDQAWGPEDLATYLTRTGSRPEGHLTLPKSSRPSSRTFSTAHGRSAAGFGMTTCR